VTQAHIPDTAILPAYISINTSTLQAIAETKVLAKIGAAPAIIEIAFVTVLVKPFEADGAALARTVMFLAAFLLTQKTLASKAQIKIDLSHFARTTALAAVVALPLATLDYLLTHPYPTNPIARLILEGIFFLTLYAISLRLFKIVAEEDLELFKKALPNQLEKILKMLENFVIHGTPP